MIPQTWDEVGALWDAPPAQWDPPPPSALFSGALLGSGFLDGILVLGVVDLEAEILGRGTLGGPTTPPTAGAVATIGDTGTSTPTVINLTTGAGETYALVRVAMRGVSLGTVASVVPSAGSPLSFLGVATASGRRLEFWGGPVPAGTALTITVTYGGGSNANAAVAAESYAGVTAVGILQQQAIPSAASSTLAMSGVTGATLVVDGILTAFGDNAPTIDASQTAEFAAFQDGASQVRLSGSRKVGATTMEWTGLNHSNGDALHVALPLFGVSGGIQLQTGVFFGGALQGVGLLAGPTIQIGAGLYGTVLGIGVFAGVFAEPPPGQILLGEVRGIGLLQGVLPAVAVLIPHIFADDVLPGSLSPELDENFAALLAVINAPNRTALGPLAERPAAGNPGALYVATDQNNEWWLDDGLAWRTMGAIGAQLRWLPSGNNVGLFGALSAGGGHVLAAKKATTLPTQALIDGAVLYVADVQGETGRATWHHLSESGHTTPLTGNLFRDGVTSFGNTTAETTLFAHGARVLKGRTLVGRFLEIWWRGLLRNDSGAVRNCTLRLRLGGLELVAITLTSVPINATGTPASVLYRLDGLTGAVQSALPVTVYSQAASAPVVITPAALDPLVDQAFDVTAQWNFQHLALEVLTRALEVRIR